MSTSPTAVAPTVDLHDQPAAETFGTNVGELVADTIDHPPQEQSLTQPMTDAKSSRCNVGHREQKIRLGAGAALLAAAAFAPVGRGWRIGLSALGFSQLLTGATRHCPVSKLLGRNTCGADES